MRAVLQQLYATRKGRLLAQLGERDAAAQVFGQIADRITAGTGRCSTSSSGPRSAAAGFDLACEHFGRALAFAEEESGGRRRAASRRTPSR